MLIEEILKYLSVFGVSMVKFLFGPLTGASVGLNYLETVLMTVAGMMATVVLLTFLGSEVRKKLIARFAQNKRKFTPRNRKIVKIWRRFGAWGISLLTPVLFSPIIGTLIVIAFGEHRKRIIHYMFVSACFWSIVINAIVFFIGKELITQFMVQ